MADRTQDLHTAVIASISTQLPASPCYLSPGGIVVGSVEAFVFSIPTYAESSLHITEDKGPD
jgi:hypothetical protein